MEQLNDRNVLEEIHYAILYEIPWMGIPHTTLIDLLIREAMSDTDIAKEVALLLSGYGLSNKLDKKFLEYTILKRLYVSDIFPKETKINLKLLLTKFSNADIVELSKQRR